MGWGERSVKALRLKVIIALSIIRWVLSVFLFDCQSTKRTKNVNFIKHSSKWFDFNMDFCIWWPTTVFTFQFGMHISCSLRPLFFLRFFSSFLSCPVVEFALNEFWMWANVCNAIEGKNDRNIMNCVLVLHISERIFSFTIHYSQMSCSKYWKSIYTKKTFWIDTSIRWG